MDNNQIKAFSMFAKSVSHVARNIASATGQIAHVHIELERRKDAAKELRSQLSPGYEPGDGSMDGAMLVDGEWWHPVMGCDSLQVVIDNIRAGGSKVRQSNSHHD
jgi:hypothetical protein